MKNNKILLPKKGILKKLTTFVPIENAEKLRNALFNAGAGNIGNYDRCSFNIDGEGTYRGNQNSNPSIGEKGENHTENETQISVFMKVKMKLQF